MRDRLCSNNVLQCCLLALFAAVVAFGGDAHADEEARKYQKQLETWGQKLPDLEKTDTGETAKDIALIRSWIGQAQAFVASEKLEQIDPILARIEAMVSFVKVRQQRVKIEKSVNDARQQLDGLNRTIAKTKAEADAMLKEIKKHEKNK